MGTRAGTDGVTLTEAATALGISRDALKKRVQRGGIPAYKDETGAWRVVLSEGDIAGDMSRDMGEGQFPGHAGTDVPGQLTTVMEQWLQPLVNQIAQQAEEIGRLRLENEQLTAALQRTSHPPEQSGDREIPIEQEDTAQRGAEREPEASWRVRLRRWMGWE